MSSVSPSVLILRKMLIISAIAIGCLPLFAFSPPEKVQLDLFLENKGQVRDQHDMPRPDVLYYGEVDGLSYHLTAGGIHYQMVQYPGWFQQKELLSKMKRSKHDLDVEALEQPITIYRVDVNYLGANERAEVVSDGRSSSVSHFYNVPLGAEPALNVRSWQSVTMKDIYMGIDLRYYQGKYGGLESDFVVQPGADYSQIALAISGAELSINTRGELVMHTPFGDILEGPVYAHQDGKEVASHWVVDGEIVRFELAGLVDPTLPLIIDPPVRLYGTYFGGSKNDFFRSTSVDGQGNIVAAGETVSTSMIATVGAHQVSYGGGTYDGVVAKYLANGELSWATYIGGSGEDGVNSCKIDVDGNTFLGGETESTTGIASPDGTKPVYIGGSKDGFLVKLNGDGVRVWGTYIGGTEQDYVNGCSIDDSGRIILVGGTTSPVGISTQGTFQPEYGGDGTDAFIMALDAAGELDWGSYIGVPYTIERGHCCTIDHDGNILFGGEAWWDFDNILASPGAHQEDINGSQNALIFKFTKDGERIWSTYFGGNDTRAYDIEIDMLNNVIVTGETDREDYVVSQGAHQVEYGGGSSDAFLAKFSPNGVFLWGTCYGGQSSDFGTGLAVNTANDIYLSGGTSSLDNIASPDGYDVQKEGISDGLLCKFSPDGSRQWATYYGGDDGDGIDDCALSGDDQIVIAGAAFSKDAISTPDGNKTSNSGAYDAFIAIFQDETSGLIPAVPVEPLVVTPNPTSGIVYINDLPESGRLTVRDVQGVVVIERQISNNTLDLDLGHLPSGMYILRVDAEDNRGAKVARVVVE
ncbi:MAG: T9SS type A sorting domain-containing protein [Lewinellaceae bacterium]|nr:T9SS type A sorting domain-containing protein [Saprospiraceae bacterium]MCB9313905.1 T9SS type A sorting domain-containing protein [Lewinellaceae bacterium]